MSHKFEIVEHIAVIGENENITIEVNLVRINDRQPVLDIRPFKKEGHVPSWGVWLLPYMVDNLIDVLNQYKAAE